MTLAKIKGINFRLSDLFLGVGFVPMVVFLIFGQLFMQHPDPNDVPLKLWAIIPLFCVLALSWGVYIFLEYKIGNSVSKTVNIVFIILSIVGVIGILSQPINFEIDFITSFGEQAHASLTISKTHYIFFTFDILSIILLIYIGLFIFPKRFRTLKIIQAIGFVVFAGCFLLNIYSYITEYGNYIPFLKALMGEDVTLIKWFSMKSCIINQNAYGMMMMVGIIFCCIHHSITKKWFYFPLIVFFYLNMVFTFCRTSLLLSPLIVIIYIYFFLFKNLSKRKKIYSALLILLTAIILVLLLIVAISYLSKGSFFAFIYKFLKFFDNGSTIGLRERIWDNTYKLIIQSMPLSLFFGKGFGIVNLELLQLNNNSGLEDQLAFPTHSGYLNLFAEGGFIYILSFIALLAYVLYIFKKCYKKQALLSISVFFGTLVFSLYALIETIHYLVYPFMFLVLVLKNIQESNNSLNPIN